MSFGKMKEPIEIIELVQVKDTDGFATYINKVIARARAYREERSGTRSWANRAAFSAATCLFRFRVIPGVIITPSNIIFCRGERYRILSVEDVRGRGMYIEILAEKISAVKGG